MNFGSHRLKGFRVPETKADKECNQFVVMTFMLVLTIYNLCMYTLTAKEEADNEDEHR